MRRLVLLGVAVAALYVVAPALSMRPYAPAAVDFEQRLPTVERAGVARAGGDRRHRGHADEGRASFRSPVIVAPQRFDLAGLAGELRPLEFRARDAGGEWSDWVETANGDPAYFGGADELQLRSQGWRPTGTLHYVNVSGTTSGLETALTRIRETVNSALITTAGLIQPAAEAAPARPAIVSRGGWGATRAEGGCRPRETPVLGEVKAATIHHTVTSDDYTAEEAPSIVLGICRYHRNANGWNDIGYNALVDRYGTVYAGRAGGLRRAVVGAHAQGFNSQTAGVAALGTHTKTPITPAAMEGFVEYLAWKLTAHGVRARGKTTLTSAGGSASRYTAGRRVRLNRIIGHGRIGLTACPGEGLERQVGKIRRRTQERIDGSPDEYVPPPPPPLPPPLPQGDGTGGAGPRSADRPR